VTSFRLIDKTILPLGADILATYLLRLIVICITLICLGSLANLFFI